VTESYRAYPSYGALWIINAVALEAEAGTIGEVFTVMSDGAVHVLTGGYGDVAVPVVLERTMAEPPVSRSGGDRVADVSITPGYRTVAGDLIHDGEPVRLVGPERELDEPLDLIQPGTADTRVFRVRLHVRPGLLVPGADSPTAREVRVQTWPEETARPPQILQKMTDDQEYRPGNDPDIGVVVIPDTVAEDSTVHLEAAPRNADSPDLVRAREDNLRRHA